MSYLLSAFRQAGGLGGNADGLGGANHPTGKAPASRPAYTPSYKPAPTSTKTVADLEQEERDRKQAAVDEANTPKSVEERSKELIKNMYGAYNGEFGGRVLTEDEIRNGYTNALGNYVAGAPSLKDLVTPEELARRRHMASSRYFYNSGLDLFEGSREIGEHDFNRNRAATGKGDIKDEALEHIRAMYGVGKDRAISAPWINTFDWDRFATYNLIRDSDYNPFLNSDGGMQSHVEGYRDDSIAGWFKNAFSGADQVKNRSKALDDLMSWKRDGGGFNAGTDLMTKQHFDQMDLANKYGLSWEQAGALVNQGQGSSQGANLNQSNGGYDTQPSGMLSPQNSSWLDVLGRGGAQNWDSLLGQYTYNSPLDWASMDNQAVQTEFSDLFDSGGMFTQGKNRDLIYAKLMENLGRV
jgi:hypothetical protein